MLPLVFICYVICYCCFDGALLLCSCWFPCDKFDKSVYFANVRQSRGLFTSCNLASCAGTKLFNHDTPVAISNKKLFRGMASDPHVLDDYGPANNIYFAPPGDLVLSGFTTIYLASPQSIDFFRPFTLTTHTPCDLNPLFQCPFELDAAPPSSRV